MQIEAVPETSYSSGAVNLLENGGLEQTGVWQIGSLPIVLRAENKTVSRIDVYVRYYRNYNTAYFDNI